MQWGYFLHYISCFMILYLIRHAQSTNNARPIEAHVPDPPLTELGVHQAQLLAEHLAAGNHVSPYDEHNGDITALYCSAMHRSLQTASIIQEAAGVTPEVWVDIHEHGGMFSRNDDGDLKGLSGKTRQDIQAEFPGYILPDDVTDTGWWHADGREDLAGCQARAIRVASQLRRWAAEERHALAGANGDGVLGTLWQGARKLAGDGVGREQCIVLISHGTFMSMLIKALTNILPAEQIHHTHYNTGVTRVDFFDEGRMAIHYMNRVEHLPANVIS